MANSFTVIGQVRDARGKPVSNLFVEAFDSDMGSSDDFLGSAFTSKTGRFKITFQEKSFRGKYDVFERDPDVYLVISDEYGVVKKTETKSAKNLKFSVKLTDDAPYHDPYANAEQRMVALFTSVGDTVDLQLINPSWTSSLILRTITSYLHYADPKITKIYGYPGPQVIARPKEFPKHDHTIPWRRTK